MADLALIRLALVQATREREQLARQLAQAANDLASERQLRAALQVSADPAEAEASAARIRDLIGRRAASARAIGALQERIRVDLEGLLGDDVELEGDVPLVLLPVRIEARSTADGTTLRVRIFHDALHSETLDEGLSDTERQAGIAYWTALWESGDAAAPWPVLLAAVGARRAPWVAEALRPKNLVARPGQPPDFPDPAPRGGRPAVARTLPDRFYVRVEQDGAAPSTVHGSAIPDELPIGLADRDEFTALQLDGEDLPPIDESLRWLVDYAEAERIGMAVTVPLPLPGHPVRRLIVYGVRAALDRLAGAARLERLIRAHRFTDGAEFVPQGTPTNNTESVRTEWSRRTPPGPPDLMAAEDFPPNANAAVTAEALGVRAELLATLAGARDIEQARAAAFNTALWTTTWGDAIEHLTPAGRVNGDQRLDSPSLDAVRDHWVKHVRGRGPLPVLRLGRQPYGVLPIVATDASWKPLRGGFVEDRLVPFIDQRVRWMWNDAQPTVATIMNRPLDAAMPEILGTDAILRGLRVRTALSPDPVMKGAMALTLPDLGDGRSGEQVTQALLLLSGVADDALDSHALLGSKTRSLALPLVHESDLAFVAGLLQPQPPHMEHRSVLQVLLAHADAVERHQRATAAPANMRDLLREAITTTRAEVDRDLLVSALDTALEGGFDNAVVTKAAEHVTTRVGRLDRRMIADRHPFPAIAPVTTVQQVAGTVPRVDRLRGDVGLQVVGEIFHRSLWAGAFRAALETISRIEAIEECRLLLSETLDCCSHRLDAWITAAASRRLGDLRAGGARGAFLGAYGWLENIELRVPVPAGQIDGREVLHDRADGGYVHAPGLTHAATAGILRSGRLTHRRTDPNNEALDIDLSSTRTRDALSLLDGMRRGQSLGALLGYRLERRLHERSGGGLELDRFIYVLRTLAPLRGGKLTEPGQPVQESLAASDVVDGLRLLEIASATVVQKLHDGPADTRYIVAPDAWVPPRAGEAEAVIAAIEELERTHDAVADLLLAESVYQLASGNPARAAAVLDVLGAGEAVPPEPEVVRTPRTGVPIQHRVAILLPDPLPAAADGWDPTSPRAQAEPRLEAWARGALGDPAAIVIAPGRGLTLADANLSALDVLYDADGDSVGASTLAARVRRALGDAGADLSSLAPIWELAGMLRGMLLAGRPLDVADVGRPVEEGATGRIPDAAELMARATMATDALRTAAAAVDPLTELARFGVRPPPDRGTLGLTPDEQAAALQALVVQANTRVAAAERLLALTVPASPPTTIVELSSQTLGAIFGGGFVAVPLLLPPPAGEADLWAGAVSESGVRAKPGADIRPWLVRAGALRSNTSVFGETLLVREALGRRPLLRVVQSPAGAFGTWAGLPFPDARPPMVPLASMVAEVAGASAGDDEPDLSQAIAGIVIDAWSEVVPRRLERRDPKDPEVAPELVDVTTTGIALNANAPGARPPQAILIALSADGGGWTGERLVHVLHEVLALARMRAVTLQQIPWAGCYLPALYFRDWSLQGEPVIDWVKVATEFRVDDALKFLAVDH
jgi:hypothetical protein